MSSIILDVSFIKIGIIFTAVYIFFVFIGMFFNMESGEGWLSFLRQLDMADWPFLYIVYCKWIKRNIDSGCFYIHIMLF